MILSLWLAACSGPDSASKQEGVLIRSNGQAVTLAQFERAFAAARIAYSDDRAIAPEVIQEARLRLLHQMTEEVIIARHAAELGVVLTEAEVAAAVDNVKKDYPEGEFEQMLLESAIPFALWQDRLRARLLMEKVAHRDLVESQTITAEEIESYYRSHTDAFAVDQDKAAPAELKHQIVEQIRREKVEAAWPQWMEGLKARYGVQINWDLWEQSRQPDAAAGSREKEDAS